MSGDNILKELYIDRPYLNLFPECGNDQYLILKDVVLLWLYKRAIPTSSYSHVIVDDVWTYPGPTHPEKKHK